MTVVDSKFSAALDFLNAGYKQILKRPTSFAYKYIAVRRKSRIFSTLINLTEFALRGTDGIAGPIHYFNNSHNNCYSIDCSTWHDSEHGVL
jgi:hypothetical protein